ncbi:MAG: DNA translocase FtsK 4TM domain-containing protein [Candidatus Magasanikbacteria bacterium]|nr:DNA translocase FtsK 4TM domain-containing protein [Candidatus Magasanikbacteria bacterium]
MYRPARSRTPAPARRPETGNNLLALFLVIAGIITLLGFYQRAGLAGEFLTALLTLGLGELRYAVPVLLLVSAWRLVRRRPSGNRHQLLGIILLATGAAGLLHLQNARTLMLAAASEGRAGGGFLGLLTAWLLTGFLELWGAVIILAALLVAGLLIFFSGSPNFWPALRIAGRAAWSALANLVSRLTAGRPRQESDWSRYSERLPPEPDGEEETASEARRFRRRPLEDAEVPETAAATTAPATAAPGEAAPTLTTVSLPRRSYRLPPLSLLTKGVGKPTAGDIKANAEIIRETFHHFGIDVEMGEVRVGPTVTQYSLKPAKGVKLSRLTGLTNDLALALAAHPIRMEAPIPGQPLVGVEVPNERVALVTLRELLESKEYRERRGELTVALGKDVAGRVWCLDLAALPHLLVAGATGSGKTVCLNAVILSLLFQHTPDTLRFLMIDPKRVELTLYNGIPHLLTPVVTDATKTVNALRWAINEMERRFTILAESHTRDLASYNRTAAAPLPYIVIVVDELADLMAAAPAEVEAGIIRLAQMARAVGLHLVVATQRPSVEVITGLMKANIPARIAFSVASLIDSRTILDTPGAEKLLGRGDLLLLTAELSKPKRLQGAFVVESEMKAVVEHLRGDAAPVYDDAITQRLPGGSSGTLNLFGGLSDDQDPLFNDARQVITESGKASASLLQRRLKVGYARAARLLDELEEAGIVGPADGAKPREVLMGAEAAADAVPDALAEGPDTLDAGGSVFDETAQEEAEPREEKEP